MTSLPQASLAADSGKREETPRRGREREPMIGLGLLFLGTGALFAVNWCHELGAGLSCQEALAASGRALLGAIFAALLAGLLLFLRADWRLVRIRTALGWIFIAASQAAGVVEHVLGTAGLVTAMAAGGLAGAGWAWLGLRTEPRSRAMRAALLLGGLLVLLTGLFPLGAAIVRPR